MDENEIVENVERAVLLEVAKKVQVEDGDILIVKAVDTRALQQLGDAFAEIQPDKKILLVDQEAIDILGEVDEETMSSLGWMKTEKAKEIAQILSDRLRDGATVDVDVLFEELKL